MLERRIEAWLKETFGVDVEFAVDKALAKLGGVPRQPLARVATE
jgi:hypothetical protein